jgi:transposase
MDSDKRSAQVDRLEVVDTGRRRRWSEDEKLKIVLESLRTPRQISATARRYGISRSLPIRWQRAFRAERRDAAERQVGFVPAMVAPGLGATPVPEKIKDEIKKRAEAKARRMMLKVPKRLTKR